MALTVAQKITIADISEYLIVNAIKKGGLFASGIDIELPNKIRNIKDSIEYQYNINPSDTTLVSTSNYLYALCGKFGLAAQQVMLISGTVSGIVATTSPTPYQFTVDASTSFIIDGQSAKTVTAFIGYNLIFIRNGVNQLTVNDGSGSYYSWTKATGSFICYPSANTSEIFGLFPI